jgi:hypothetical protein
LKSRIDSSPQLKPPSESSQKPSSSLASRTGPLVYAIAILFGLFSGWVNQKVDDALLTSLCVLAFSMLMGVWKKQRPWRWMLLVWMGVPLVLGYYQFVVGWPHDRGQVYGAFLQLLAASAGAHGGHFMRAMIDHVFLQQGD